MKVALLCPILSREGGGLFEIERRLAQGLHATSGVDVTVFGTSDFHLEDDLAQWAPVAPVHGRYYGPSSFRYAPRLRRQFLASNADIAHLNSLWMYTSILALEWAGAVKPYVTTVHGMLDPWALRNSAWRKRICGALYEWRALRTSRCLQVSAEAEMRSVRQLGFTNPISVIPNGVDLPAQDVKDLAPPAHGKKVLLYLGRLHPKKNLPGLLDAWAQVRSARTADAWQLAIAGWDQGGHESQLRSLCDELRLSWTNGPAHGDAEVAFLGPQFGVAKAHRYAGCSAFVLPSFSEGLPMTVLEAWAYAKPVIMTPACNLPEGERNSAALISQPAAQDLERTLRELLEMSDGQRAAMGSRGRQLVQEKFTWTAVVQQVYTLYQWILGGGQVPPSVVS